VLVEIKKKSIHFFLKPRRLFLDIYRRISLLYWGYHSPPFRLVQLRRRKFIWSWTRFFYDFRHDHGLPIIGIFDREIPKKKPTNKTTLWFWSHLKELYMPIGEEMAMSDKGEYHYSLYLRPDRLRWSTWGLGFLLAITLSLTSHHYWIALSILLWMGFGIQMLVFGLRRVPVLNQVWPSWPGQTGNMNEWLKGIPQFGYDSRYSPKGRLKRYSFFIFFCLPPFPFKERSDMTTWMPSGSCQESFLRAAVVDHFVGLSESPENISRRLIFRWMFDWLFPIWGSFLALSLFAAYCAITHNFDQDISLTLWTMDILLTFKKDPNDCVALAALAISWFAGTTFILWRELHAISHWCCLAYEDVLALPAAVRRLIHEPNPQAINQISSRTFIKLQTIAHGIILVSFLALADILSP